MKGTMAYRKLNLRGILRGDSKQGFRPGGFECGRSTWLGHGAGIELLRLSSSIRRYEIVTCCIWKILLRSNAGVDAKS